MSETLLMFVIYDFLMDDEKYHSIIQSKCFNCFRKDSSEDRCMLYSSKHAGIELCLGPYKNQEDRLKKIREDFEKEKKKADLGRIAREVPLNAYKRNKKIFDE